MKSIGFIGTGVMGGPMAQHLMDKGFSLYVYNRTKEKAAPLLQKGAIWCDSVAECAAGRDAVITILGYPKDVREVYLGEGGVVQSADAGCFLIDMTTTDPSLSVEIDAQGKKRGLHCLDAPVSGGDVGAKNATLTIMVGGERPDFDACLPLFEAMGSSVVYEGAAGSGQHVKLCNQIAIAGAVSGVCEAVAYAKAAGIDTGVMLKTIGGGAANSWQLQNLGPKMAAGDFAPGFFIKHFIKDMRLADEQALAHGLTLEILQKVCAIYTALEAGGMGENGTQGVICHYLKP